MQECNDAEWFNAAGPILFSWASVSSRKPFDHRIINAKNTRTTVVVKAGTMTASDGGRDDVSVFEFGREFSMKLEMGIDRGIQESRWLGGGREDLGDEGQGRGRERKTGQEIIGDVDIACAALLPCCEGSCGSSVNLQGVE